MTIDAAKAADLWAKGWVSRSQILAWQTQGWLSQQEADDILSSPGGHG